MIQERNGIKELKIFWNFEKDNNLPKFKKNAKFENGNFNINVGGDGTPMGWNDDNDNESDYGYRKMNIFKKFFLFLYNKFVLPYKEKRKTDRRQTTILEFFTSLSSHFMELSSIGEIAETYEKALNNAYATGQVALQEKIKNIVDVSRTEIQLHGYNLNKYISEQQLIDFYEAADKDKNLKLTWIKNFAKVIPTDLVELKKDLDAKELFDNYVILHYDPNNDATTLTLKEKEIKKDPILFGVLEHSNRLYYVGDWKDEYCDLTLEDMFTSLGEEVLKINNESLKTFINKAGDYEQDRVKKKKTNVKAGKAKKK